MTYIVGTVIIAAAILLSTVMMSRRLSRLELQISVMAKDWLAGSTRPVSAVKPQRWKLVP
jgi:hypothetical protein